MFERGIDEVDPGLLAVAIREEYQRKAWSDDILGYQNGIAYLSEGDVSTHAWGIAEKICWFDIRSMGLDLRKGQVSAYRRHLAQLASSLAERGPPYVKRVCSVIEVRGADAFKARAQ